MELAIFEQGNLDHNGLIEGDLIPYATGCALFDMSITENQNPRASTASGGVDQIQSLVERARAGDRAAFEQIILVYQNEIFRLAYVRTRSRMDAEDLTQEVFLAAFKYLPQLKDSDRFRPWLYRIAINRVRDFHRRKKILSFFGLSGEERDVPDPVDREPHRDPGALDKVIRDEFWSQVRQLSKRFSPMEREVFFLRFVDNFNLREIAQVLRKSESAVKTHLYRAIKKFKEDSAMSGFLEGEWHGENRPS